MFVLTWSQWTGTAKASLVTSDITKYNVHSNGMEKPGHRECVNILDPILGVLACDVHSPIFGATPKQHARPALQFNKDAQRGAGGGTNVKKIA